MASDIPDSIVEAFRVRPLMPFPELARLLGMDPATLRDHVIAGDLPWRQKGRGENQAAPRLRACGCRRVPRKHEAAIGQGARPTMQRGNPALLGKGIERRREADQWNYRFIVAGQAYYGPCNTYNKQKAERYSAQLKADKKVDTRRDRDLGLGADALRRRLRRLVA